jgi:hypothetical protein
MYCPQCGTEYRPGFTQCSDCHVPLVDALPPEPEPPSPDLEVVTVLTGNNPIAIALAEARLEQADIPFFTTAEDFAERAIPTSPLLYPWSCIEVARDREAEARAALEAISPEDLVLDEDKSAAVELPDE